jgi:hypothetical protein
MQVLIQSLYVFSVLWFHMRTDTHCVSRYISSLLARTPCSQLLLHPLGTVCSCIVQCFRCPGGSIGHTAETHRGHWLWFQSQGHWWHVSDRGWQTPSAKLYHHCWVRDVNFRSNKMAVVSWFSRQVSCSRSRMHITDCPRNKEGKEQKTRGSLLSWKRKVILCQARRVGFW